MNLEEAKKWLILALFFLIAPPLAFIWYLVGILASFTPLNWAGSWDELVLLEKKLLSLLCTKVVRTDVIAGLGTWTVTDDRSEADTEAASKDATEAASRVSEETRLLAAEQKRIATRSTTKSRKKIPLVLVHGYGAGNGYWAWNVDKLQDGGFQCYCVELPGMGRSDRPPWKGGLSCEEAYDFFVAHLEKWREAMALEKFVLLGHSLGAHCASAYSMAHPDRVQHLVLVSPVGVGMPPLHLRPRMSPKSFVYAKHQRLDVNEDPTPQQEDGNSHPVAELQSMMDQPHKQTLFFKFTTMLMGLIWDAEWTPFDVTRLLGPLGPTLSEAGFRRRIRRAVTSSHLRKLSTEQVKTLSLYTFHNHALPASGERILASILMPGAFARMPLILWLSGRDVADQKGKPGTGLTCPVTMVYGSRGTDWMQASFGYELQHKLMSEGVDVDVVEMRGDCGHLCYLEEPHQFSDIIVERVLGAGRH